MVTINFNPNGKFVYCKGCDLSRLYNALGNWFNGFNDGVNVSGIDNAGEAVYYAWVPLTFKADYVW